MVCLSGYTEVVNDFLQKTLINLDNPCQEQSTQACVGDMDGDLEVTVSDVLDVLSDFGCASACTMDINGDGVTNVTCCWCCLPLAQRAAKNIIIHRLLLTSFGFVLFCAPNSPNHVNNCTPRVEGSLAVAQRFDLDRIVRCSAHRLVAKRQPEHQFHFLFECEGSTFTVSPIVSGFSGPYTFELKFDGLAPHRWNGC